MWQNKQFVWSIVAKCDKNNIFFLKCEKKSVTLNKT